MNCGSDIEASSQTPKILVAYFSVSGNTEQVAKYINQQVGGDLYEIEPAVTYPSDYQGTVDRGEQERDMNARPKIATSVNMNDYDTIFIGYPIWCHTPPMIIRTFLESYDFSGKTVIPFCTSSSSPISETLDVINEYCTNSTVLEGLTANGSEADINSWLDDVMKKISSSSN